MIPGGITVPYLVLIILSIPYSNVEKNVLASS
jgi:hypothetical protein